MSETAARKRPRLTGVIVLGLVAVALLALIASVSLDEGDEDPIEIEGAGAVQRLLGGIPQEGSRLGSESAPVTVEVINDMQCGTCADFQLAVIGALIEDLVRGGEVALDYRHSSLSDRSTGRAFYAAAAAGEQDRQWQYIHLFFLNQDEAREHGVTDELLERIAAAVLELDPERWRDDVGSPAVARRVEEDAEITALRRLPAEPAAIVDGPRGTRELSETPSLDQILEAIEQVG